KLLERVSELEKRVLAPRDVVIKMYITKNLQLSERIEILEKQLRLLKKNQSSIIEPIVQKSEYPIISIPVIDYPSVFTEGVGFGEYLLTVYASYQENPKHVYDTFVFNGRVRLEFFSSIFAVTSLFKGSWFVDNFTISTGDDIVYFAWKLVALQVVTSFMILLRSFENSIKLSLKTHILKPQLSQTAHFLQLHLQQFTELVTIKCSQYATTYTSQPPISEYTKRITLAICTLEDTLAELDNLNDPEYDNPPPTKRQRRGEKDGDGKKKTLKGRDKKPEPMREADSGEL
ncbi:ORF24, partial [white sturgeon herpesvirus 2]